MLLLLILALLRRGSTEPENLSDYKTALKSHLSLNYNLHEVPLLSGNPVPLKLGYYLRSVVNLDDRNEILTTNAWFSVDWQDYRLSWNKSEFGSVSHMFFGRNSVWIPDLTVDNTVTEYQVLGRADDVMRLTCNGSVLWIPGNIYRTKCEMDITYFPFDQQLCKIKVFPWIYRNDEVQIHSLFINKLPEIWNRHGEWNVINISGTVNEEEFNVSSGVDINILLKRRYIFYIFNVIVPLALTTVLNVMVVILQTESKDKITLTSTIFLSYFVFISYISDNIPNTSKSISVLGVLISVQLGICALSVLLSLYTWKPCQKKI